MTFAAPLSFLLLVCTASLAAQAPPANAPTTVMIEGRVTDLMGEPIPAVEVVVQTERDVGPPIARGMSDGDGYFRVARVPDRRFWYVQAVVPGRCAPAVHVSKPPKAVTLHAHDAATVTGRLTNRAGAPVANAIVRAELACRILHGAHVDAQTDDDGRFELVGVPLGFVYFAAVMPGEGLAIGRHSISGDTELALTPDDEATTALSIRIEGLPKAATPTVRASILPYSGGRLSKFPPPWDNPAIENGNLEFEHVPNCRYIIYARSDGYAFAPRQARLDAGSGPHELVFTATKRESKALDCAVRVTDGEGQPVANVTFEMRASNGGNRTSATTDEKGMLVIESPLAAGQEAVIYSKDDRWVTDQDLSKFGPIRSSPRDSDWHRFKVDPDETLELRVVPACTVAGRLLLADGRPAAFVRITLQEASPNRWPRWMNFDYASTDRAGNYRFTRVHHQQCDVRVHVESAAGQVESDVLALPQPGTRVTVPELRLNEPAVIEGVVHDSSGQPVGGARVWLRDWDFDRGGQKSGSVTETLTDRQGRYRFRGVPPGGAWLQLFRGARSPNSKAVEPFLVEAGSKHSFNLELADG